MKDIGLTHIALPVADIEKSIAFYSKYARMQVVHRRGDESTGSEVVWISDKTRPGFSENMLVLKWIVDRAHGRALARETPIGWMPNYEDIEWQGLDFPNDKFEELQAFDRDAWRNDVLGHEELFLELHDRLAPETIYERELLICRL